MHLLVRGLSEKFVGISELDLKYGAIQFQDEQQCGAIRP